MKCPHCLANEPSVWDDVLFHYAHPADGNKLKNCHEPWRERCHRCSGALGECTCGAPPQINTGYRVTETRLTRPGTTDGARMIHAEPSTAACSACNEKLPQETLAVTIGAVTAVLCQACGDYAATSIQNKLWQRDKAVPSCTELTSGQVASFATYPLNLLLDELVMCTVRWHVGPLDADERRIAIALLERLAALGIARKIHRAGCEIWPKYRLCGCPWAVPS